MYLSRVLARKDISLKRRINIYFKVERVVELRDSTDKAKENVAKKANRLIKKGITKGSADKTREFLKGTGLGLSVEEFIMLRIFLMSFFGGGLYFIYENLMLMAFGITIGYILPKLWISRKRKQRIQKFNEQLPDMITAIIGSLRSGYSFQQALKTVVEEGELPVKEEIEQVLKETSCGISLEDALNNLYGRMPSSDLELMIQAVLIQRQVGGNLSIILETITKTIRERVKIQRQVKTLTSQGRMSGRVIGALPIALGFAIYLINPEYMNALFESTGGLIVLAGGAISSLIGFIIINRLTKIEV
jgi:tight adherence protein B